MNPVKDLILKYLACSYVLYCQQDLGSYISFEEYCNRFNSVLKNETEFVNNVMKSAKKTIKYEKKVGKK